MQKPWQQALGVLTGAVGDHLARTGNGLATPMTLAQDGEVLAATPEALGRAWPQASARVVVLVHGLMATELAWAFPQPGPLRDYGTDLAAQGWTALRVRYNSGLALERSAADLLDLLDAVVRAWPVPVTEIALIGHSMGGLVAREACALASARTAPGASPGALVWPARVRHVACLGTPHLGAPLERVGRWLAGTLRGLPDPVARLVGEWADLRSEGIRQLGAPTTVFWLAGARHLLVASSLAGHSALAPHVGDGMVSVRSALAQGRHVPEPVDRHLLHGIHHASLACSPQVSALLQAWLPRYPAPEPIAAPPAAPGPTARKPRRLRDLAVLAQDTVRHGHRGIRQVRLARADQALAVVQGLVPAAAGPAKVAWALHAGLVAVQHGAVDAALAACAAVTPASTAGPPAAPVQPAHHSGPTEM